MRGFVAIGGIGRVTKVLKRRCHPGLARFAQSAEPIDLFFLHEQLDPFTKLVRQTMLSSMFRQVFDGLDPEKNARYTDNKLEKILLDPRIIRNRLKVYAVRKNARAYLEMQEAGLDFSHHLWSFVEGEPINNKIQSMDALQATSEISDALSKDLKKRGFSFVGSTIIYAFMQAVGMYNDHVITCFRHRELS